MWKQCKVWLLPLSSKSVHILRDWVSCLEIHIWEILNRIDVLGINLINVASYLFWFFFVSGLCFLNKIVLKTLLSKFLSIYQFIIKNCVEDFITKIFINLSIYYQNIHTKKSFINGYLGYSHKQKILKMVTLDVHSNKKV